MIIPPAILVRNPTIPLLSLLFILFRVGWLVVRCSLLLVVAALLLACAASGQKKKKTSGLDD